MAMLLTDMERQEVLLILVYSAGNVTVTVALVLT